uniref:Cytochrome c oxidase assembly factor 6 homolog n=4 Tax=Neoaves TaxID=3078114 RepID=A0A8C4U7X6_FALTI
AVPCGVRGLPSRGCGRRMGRGALGQPLFVFRSVAKMSAPTMEERKACWGARDEFWQCLDRHADDASKCEKLRLSFESRCPQQWVKYFDKRRDFLKYKRKLETEGYHPPEAAGKS